MEDMMENVKFDIYRKHIGPFNEHVRLKNNDDRSGNQDAHFLIPDKILNQKPPSNLLHSDVTILAAGSWTTWGLSILWSYKSAYDCTIQVRLLMQSIKL